MHRKTLLVGLLALCSIVAIGCQVYLDDGRGFRGGRGGTGFTCGNNFDCAAGCYCEAATGTCQEGGFCNLDSDCPAGFVCDSRSSCVEDDSAVAECSEDADCPAGSFCDESTGACAESTDCSDDAQCPEGQICDEERTTCIPAPCVENSDCPTGSYCDQNSGQCVLSSVCGADGACPEGSTCDTATNTCVPEVPDAATCQGEVICDEQPPVCEEGTNPGIVAGCYNGQCVADVDCPDGAPIFCSDHTTEADCTADATCDPVYRGINCTDPDGLPCSEEEANCTCESFRFNECVDDPTP